VIGIDELVVVTADRGLNRELFIDTIQDEESGFSREKGSGTREVFLDYIKD